MKLLREIKAKLKFWHGPSLEIGYFGTQRLNYCVEGEARNYWPGDLGSRTMSLQTSRESYTTIAGDNDSCFAYTISRALHRLLLSIEVHLVRGLSNSFSIMN